MPASSQTVTISAECASTRRACRAETRRATLTATSSKPLRRRPAPRAGGAQRRRRTSLWRAAAENRRKPSLIANHRPFGADPVNRARLASRHPVTEPRHLGREVECRQPTEDGALPVVRCGGQGWLYLWCAASPP